MNLIAAIPSPSVSSFSIGPLIVHFYALSILAGIIAAYFIIKKRWAERGGDPEEIFTIVAWAVPFGIVGGRLYHVFSSPDAYWGPNGNPVRAFYIWEGGLGIWGAVALGALGVWLATRKLGVKFAPIADTIAPALLVAQAIGRLGNWFNQELFGGPTDLPWGLQIDDAHLPAGFESGTLFHPTFLYELLWNLAAAGLLLWLDRKYKMGHGQVFWLYVLFYTIGRGWIEMVRIDPAEMIGPFRLNVWTSIILGTIALVVFFVVTKRRLGREKNVYIRDISLQASPPEP